MIPSTPADNFMIIEGKKYMMFIPFEKKRSC